MVDEYTVTAIERGKLAGADVYFYRLEGVPDAGHLQFAMYTFLGKPRDPVHAVGDRIPAERVCLRSRPPTWRSR